MICMDMYYDFFFNQQVEFKPIKKECLGLWDTFKKMDPQVLEKLEARNTPQVILHLNELIALCSQLENEDVGLFTLWTYYNSLGTYIFRKIIRLESENEKDLAMISALLFTVRKWKTIEEFKKMTPWFVEKLDYFFDEEKHLPHSNPLVTKTIQYIKKHYQDQHLTIKTIADTLGVSRGYLGQLFKSHMDKNLTQYIKEYRIRQACEDLKNTTHMNEEIARRNGFKSSGNFIKAFKSILGITPQRYRRQEFLANER